MSEGGSETPKPNPSRRDVLKKVGIGAATVSLVGAGVREVMIGKEGLSTTNGIFFPLYERHDIGLDPKKIPSELDFLFKEGMSNKAHYDADPSLFFGTLKQDLVEALDEKNIKLIVGDTDLILGRSRDASEDMADLHLKEFTGGMLIGLSGYLYNHIKNVVDEVKGREPSKKEVSRRKFIKRGTLAAAAWATAPFSADYASALSLMRGFDPNQMNAVQRILVRLNGLVGNVHPEEHIGFFRNLIMADKMLTVAEAYHKRNNVRPNIGFNLGAAHAGIEDMLVVGHDFVRNMILMYPEDFLRNIVEINGSTENFSTARVMSAPVKSKISDTPVFRNKPSQVVDEKIVDLHLKSALDKKLAV